MIIEVKLSRIKIDAYIQNGQNTEDHYCDECMKSLVLLVVEVFDVILVRLNASVMFIVKLANA